MALSFFDIRSPLTVIGHRVHAEADDLAVSFLEFVLEPSHISKFCGANGSKVFRV
jgi:hypothetical protein